MSYDVERGVPTIHIGSAGAPSYPDTCGTTVTYPSKPAPHQDHNSGSGIVAKCTKFFCSLFALGSCLCFLLVVAIIITCIVLTKNLKNE